MFSFSFYFALQALFIPHMLLKARIYILIKRFLSFLLLCFQCPFPPFLFYFAVCKLTVTRHLNWNEKKTERRKKEYHWKQTSRRKITFNGYIRSSRWEILRSLLAPPIYPIWSFTNNAYKIIFMLMLIEYDVCIQMTELKQNKRFNFTNFT